MTALDTAQCLFVTADQGQSDVGPQGLRQRADARPSPLARRDRISVDARDRTLVIVFDNEKIGITGQHAPELASAFAVESGAGRILRSGRDHYSRGAGGDGLGQAWRQRSSVVDGYRQRHKPHGADEVDGWRIAGILDRDYVTRPQVSVEHTLDGIKGTARERNSTRLDAGLG